MTVNDLHARLVREVEGETGRDHRKIGNNTYARIEGEWGPFKSPVVIIHYHSTDIAEITQTTAMYRTGGWWTYTTKERINRFLPAGLTLHSDRGVWYLSAWRPTWHRVTRFYDEITLGDGPDGIVVTSGVQLDDPDRELRKAIEGYVKLYSDERLLELVERARASGTNGDCLPCQLGAESAFGGDHLLYHIGEGYTMATLAANAVKAAGYRPEIYLGGMSEHWHDGTTIRRCIRKYMRKHLLNKGLRPLTEAELEEV